MRQCALLSIALVSRMDLQTRTLEGEASGQVLRVQQRHVNSNLTAHCRGISTNLDKDNIITMAKKTPIMTVTIWRHNNCDNIPLWVSPIPAPALAAIEQQIRDTILPAYAYACPFHNCGKTFKKKTPYSKHIRGADGSHTQHWITMPEPLRTRLLQVLPWDALMMDPITVSSRMSSGLKSSPALRNYVRSTILRP